MSTTTSPSRELLRWRNAIFAIFFATGYAVASWMSRIPRLRDDLGVLPPGDLRMALAALCDDSQWGRTWSDVMQHRFSIEGHPDEGLDNHALGNLLIVTLWELLGDPVEGLRWAGALLGARGQVLPMSCLPLVIEGE